MSEPADKRSTLSPSLNQVSPWRDGKVCRAAGVWTQGHAAGRQSMRTTKVCSWFSRETQGSWLAGSASPSPVEVQTLASWGCRLVSPTTFRVQDWDTSLAGRLWSV